MKVLRMSNSAQGPEKSGDTLQIQVVETLRRWALEGKIDPARKLSELGLAQELGVSRTPVRHALALLTEEGVLQRAGIRGYRLRSYEMADVVEAVELRALMEGRSARHLARKGITPAQEARFRACLAAGDAFFADPALDATAIEAAYAAMNRDFHSLILEGATGQLQEQVMTVLDRLPFGAPDQIRFAEIAAEDRIRHLHRSHLDHHTILQAILQRDGSRAEALMREHGEQVKISLGIAPAPFPVHAGSLPIRR